MAGKRVSLGRRFHIILSRSVYSLITWLLALIVAITIEGSNKGFSPYSYTWFLMTLPLYSIVMFGVYALINIGWHMITIEDCKDAQEEVFREVKEAQTFLKSKGMKFD